MTSARALSHAWCRRAGLLSYPDHDHRRLTLPVIQRVWHQNASATDGPCACGRRPPLVRCCLQVPWMEHVGLAHRTRLDHGAAGNLQAPSRAAAGDGQSCGWRPVAGVIQMRRGRCELLKAFNRDRSCRSHRGLGWGPAAARSPQRWGWPVAGGPGAGSTPVCRQHRADQTSGSLPAESGKRETTGWWCSRSAPRPAAGLWACQSRRSGSQPAFGEARP